MLFTQWLYNIQSLKCIALDSVTVNLFTVAILCGGGGGGGGGGVEDCIPLHGFWIFGYNALYLQN